MKIFQKKLLNWLLVILWMAVIFYFSSQPDLKSSLPSIWDTVFRKIAHMSEYFVLAYLFAQALKNYKLSFKIIILLTSFFSVLYAISDEFHQSFVIGRQGSLRDVLIDSAGVLIFIILINIKRKKHAQ